MAAPYVAGASMLVREAMEFLGYEEITQDVIFSHLRATADLVFDEVTGTPYHRINLESAVEGLMPDDDYGSSTTAAFALGTPREYHLCLWHDRHRSGRRLLQLLRRD